MNKIAIVVALFSTMTYASDWTVAGGDKGIVYVAIDPAKAADADTYRMAAAKVCKLDAKCRVWFWADRSMVPAGKPWTNEQTFALRAKYTYDRTRGVNDFYFDCRVVKGEKQCFGGKR